MRIELKLRDTSHGFESSPGERLLYAGLRSGVPLPYECASGTCGSCKALVVSGEVEDLWPEAPGRKHLKGSREALLCQCAARSDCVVEVRSARPVAPLMSTPVGGRGRVVDQRVLARDVVAFAIELDRTMEFQAGQFVGLQFPGITGYRCYSMVNFAAGARRLEFVVKRKAGGRLSSWLFENAIEGHEVDWFGPLGSAVFRADCAQNILSIAGGSGIAGMMSILSHAVAVDHFSRYRGHVFFGVRTMQDAFYLSELNALALTAAGRLEVTVALSDERHADELPQYPALRLEHGLVHEVAQAAMRGRYDNVVAYLAGPPPAVNASMRFLLLDAKLPAQSIKFDKFS